MIDVKKCAEEADVIINGYAIERCEDGFRVLNLNDGAGTAVFQKDGKLVETNMDDIEVSIARDHMLRSLKYMEE